AEAVMWLDHYDERTQELLLCLLPLVARLSEGSLKKPDPHETAATLTQLNGVAAKLRPRAALIIDKLCFCNTIDQFGVYAAREENDPYAPGDPAVLYVELQNFSNVPMRGKYAVLVDSTIEIRTEDGNVFRRLAPIKG